MYFIFIVSRVSFGLGIGILSFSITSLVLLLSLKKQDRAISARNTSKYQMF
jgi:hypothetical protein